ncbi:5684_t:CDS:2, partial [Funneliformis geosporum]
ELRKMVHLGFNNIGGFNNIIGAIDAIVDYRDVFIDYEIGWPGSVHDAK